MWTNECTENVWVLHCNICKKLLDARFVDRMITIEIQCPLCENILKHQSVFTASDIILAYDEEEL